MSAEQNVALARRHFDEVCNARKLNIADDIYSSNHVYHDPSAPAGLGPQGVKDVIGTYHRAMSDAHWDVREVISGDGDRVIVRWAGSGTQNGELLGMPPTGKRVTNVTGTWIFRISGGKIVESWNNWDCLGMLQQLGVVPSMAETKKA